MMFWIYIVAAYIILGIAGAVLLSFASSNYVVQLISTFFAILIVQSVRGYFYPFLIDVTQDYPMMVFLTLIINAVICGFTLLFTRALLLMFKKQ